MVYTVNKSANPYNGLNITMRALEKTKLTKHKIGFSYADEELIHADMIILGNYLPEDVYSIAKNLPTRVRIGYIFCSPFGQASCNGEMNLLYNLLLMLNDRDCRLDYLFCSDAALPKVFDHPKIKYLPVVSDFEGAYVKPPDRSGILLIGNNLRPSRNFVNQLAAIKILQRDLGVNTPVNSHFMPQEAYQFYQYMFDLANWENHIKPLSDEEKVRVVASSKIGLQVTYSDSFNIAAYEHAMCHVPCMVSASLSWVPDALRVTKVDSPKDIARSMGEVLKDLVYLPLSDFFREKAKKEMEIRYSLCDKVLRECL